MSNVRSAQMFFLGVGRMRIVFFGVAVATGLSIAGVAMAADLNLPVAVDPTTALDWNGGYVGVSVGRGSGISDRQFTGLDFTYAEDELDGWLAGVQAGYNFQTGNLLLGVEGGIDWTSLSTAGAPSAMPRTVDWMGSIRGRGTRV